MLTNILKFTHLLSTIGLLGIVVYCLFLVGFKKTTDNQNDLITRLNKIILLLSFLALITGTLLVHPKNFTFHTPWIQAAYLLLLVFCGIIFSLILFKKNTPTWARRCIYLIAVIILIGVIHDAVTKSTFL